MKYEGKIKINLEIDPECANPKIIIKANRKTELIERLIMAVESCTASEPPRITVYDGYNAILLSMDDIVRVFIKNRKVFVCALSGTYEARSSLQKLENMLAGSGFARVSRSEIVNLRRVEGFDLSVTGTIKLSFEDGSETFVARRRVRDIQDIIQDLDRI